MENIGTRIEALRIERGLTKSDIWKAAGLSSGAYSHWMNGGALKGETLIKVANILKVHPAWLETGKGQRDSKKPIEVIDLQDNPDYPTIRRVTLKLSAGQTGFAIEFDIEDRTPISFSKEWFDRNNYRPDKLIATKVHGQSMEPGLYEDDTVVINTAETKPIDGKVFAVNYEGELLIKRLVRDMGMWWITSDNPDQRRYPRKECAGESCIILGRIVHKQSEHI
jgi:phage repressor protein C with HTH and peptisase S24 domain